MTATCVLIDAGPAHGLVALPRRRRDALWARVFGRRLDDQLAAGASPESSRLLAVRAAQITSRPARRRLARHWAELAARARQPQFPFDPRAPISPARIDAAAEHIESIADMLRADRPLSARGVALATTLLTSARSPVYRLGGGGAEDLAAAVARAVATM